MTDFLWNFVKGAVVTAVILGVLVLVGCSDSPSAPSGGQNPPSTREISGTSEPPPASPTPGAPAFQNLSLRGVDWASLDPLHSWFVPNVPDFWDLEMGYDWTDDYRAETVNTGGKHTRTDPGNLSWSREAGGLRVTWKRDARNCGSVQLDISRRGGGMVFDAVIWYPPCKPPVIESCPAGLDVAKTKASQRFEGGDGIIDWHVLAGYKISVSAASYVPDSPPDIYGYGWVKQIRAGYSGLQTFEGPGVFTTRIAVSGTNQFDGVCGDSPERLDASNISDYDRRTVTYKLKCETPGCLWESFRRGR